MKKTGLDEEGKIIDFVYLGIQNSLPAGEREG